VHFVTGFEPPPTGSIADMSEADFVRFVNHMLWFILDEVEPLWSVLTPPSTQARTRPSLWPPADVSRLFLAWFDAELLMLVRGADGEQEVPEADARALLVDTDRWQAAEPAEVISVAGTTRGRETPDEAWLSIARSVRTA
jgi:hypothetical protein